MSAEASPVAADVERVFALCLGAVHDTVLRGGAEEPLYEPPTEASPAVIRYRHDYVASALHEVAHWCIAGARRRRLADYGYWYAEAGRDAVDQRAFEAVELRPQALEWLFSDAIGTRFQPSLDNPGRKDLDPAPFARALAVARRELLARGLPPRAAVFLDALRRSGSAGAGTATDPSACAEEAR